MAEVKIPDSIPKPFANYDIVVYFGGALFFLPFINRYVLEPTGAVFPNFRISIGTQIAAEAVSLLSLLFSVYIVGHILAYISSQVIEKTADRFLGKISSAILISSIWHSRRNDLLRAFLFNRFKRMRGKRARSIAMLRLILHVPAFPIYAIIFFVGIFGHFDTRISNDMRKRLSIKYAEKVSENSRVSLNSPWFKAMEYYVINKYPNAIPRMYNYLVISGLFRTLSFVFLFSSWSVLYYSIHYAIDGDWLLKPLFGITNNSISLVEFLMLITLYTFCVLSYLKFQRRYAEEAIFAFIFPIED